MVANLLGKSTKKPQNHIALATSVVRIARKKAEDKMDIRTLAEVLSLDKDDEKNNLGIDLLEKEIKQISFIEKHKKASKPYCQKNIINKNFNTKKKGGR